MRTLVDACSRFLGNVVKINLSFRYFYIGVMVCSPLLHLVYILSISLSPHYCSSRHLLMYFVEVKEGVK